MKKRIVFCSVSFVVLASLILAGCGGGGGEETTETLPDIPTVDYSPLNPASVSEAISGTSVSKKDIVIDDDSPAIGENQVWMLQAAQHNAQNATQMLEGMVMEDSRGRSLFKTMSSEMTGMTGETKTPVMGPHDVVSPTGDPGKGYVGMDFSSFTGCDSNGKYSTSVSSSSPLSITVFVGSSASALSSNPAFSLCVTDLTEGSTAGTIWMRPIRAQAMVSGTVPTSTATQMKTTWDDNYAGSDCPFTTCRKFVSLMYDPDNELSSIVPDEAQTPEALTAIVYISKEDSDLMYVNTRMNFSENSTPITTGEPKDLRCFIENGFGVNSVTDGAEVAGTFTNYYNNELVTIDNGGIVETDDCGDVLDPGSGKTIAQFFEEILGSFATGACHTATELVTTADCALAPLYTLADEPSLDDVETDVAYPADAPSEYTE